MRSEFFSQNQNVFRVYKVKMAAKEEKIDLDIFGQVDYGT
jgi:hypothetical protein